MATKTVKRIKLSNNKAEEVEVVPKKTETTRPPASTRSNQPRVSLLLVPFVGVLRYFKGSWDELRLVRWPNRRSTWGLTLAVILFTAFFVIIILALDGAFQYLFKEVLLK